MTYRPVFEMLKDAFLQRSSKYAGAEVLSEDCAHLVLDTLSVFISESELYDISVGNSVVCDGRHCEET